MLHLGLVYGRSLLPLSRRGNRLTVSNQTLKPIQLCSYRTCSGATRSRNLRGAWPNFSEGEGRGKGPATCLVVFVCAKEEGGGFSCGWGTAQVPARKWSGVTHPKITWQRSVNKHRTPQASLGGPSGEKDSEIHVGVHTRHANDCWCPQKRRQVCYLKPNRPIGYSSVSKIPSVHASPDKHFSNTIWASWRRCLIGQRVKMKKKKKKRRPKLLQGRICFFFSSMKHKCVKEGLVERT